MSKRAGRGASAKVALLPGPESSEREGRLRVVIRLASLLYWESDAEHRITRVVSGTAPVAGEESRAQIGRTPWDLPTSRSAAAAWAAHKATLDAHRPFRDFEFARIWSDGAERQYRISGEPRFDAEGVFLGYRGISQNISDLKRAEATLREAEERNERLLTASPDAIWIHRSGTIQYVNDALLKLLGYDCAADIIGRQIYDLVAPESREAVRRRVDWLYADNRTTPLTETAMLRRDGSRVDVEATGASYRQGDAPWVISILRDVTERRRAAKALSESEARFRSLLQLSSDWYWEQDADLRFTRFEGVHDLGGTRSAGTFLIGRTRWDAEQEIEGGWDAHRALLAAHKPFREVVVRRTLPDGSVRYVSSSGEPMFDESGGFCGYRGVGRDITEQKRTEELIRIEHAVARCLADAEDVSAALKDVMREICETQSWQCARYLKVDDGAGLLRFSEFWCVPGDDSEALLPKLRLLTYGQGVGLVGSAWQSGQPLWVADIHRDPRTSHAVFSFESGTNGLFVFPVKAEGRTIGVFAFNSRNVREPDERLLRSANVIGSQVGQFLRRKRAEEVLRESEERFRDLTKLSSDFYWETDAGHRFTMLVYGREYTSTQPRNSQLCKTRWEIPSTRPDAAGWAVHKATLDAHLPYRDFEFSRARPDGSEAHYMTSGEPRFAADGTFLGYRGVGRNITELVRARERIAQLAYSDALTGLQNRTSFAPALELAVNRALRFGRTLAVIFLDLDGFKRINDEQGHDVGDRLLVEAARRMRTALRSSDLVARLGGDEFVVVLEEFESTGRVETVARKLLAEIARPYPLVADAESRVSASLGISMLPNDAKDAETLLKHADTAMYRAKESGKNRYCFFSLDAAPAPEDRAARRRVRRQD